MLKMFLITSLLCLAYVQARTEPRADFTAGLAAVDAGDYALSHSHWQALAQAGDPEAQIALAGLLSQGLGVAADPAKAAAWYRQAARQGAAMAQLNLGDLYARGRGVPRDLVKAYAWLELAARSGKAWARRRRDEIGRQLGSVRIVTARALAEKLLDRQ